MRIDTLRYKYHYQATKPEMYRTLIAEQLKYFQRMDHSIKQIKTGTAVEAKLTTKVRKLTTANKMTVQQIKPEHCFQLVTQQPAGKIIQTFEFTADRRGRNVLIYSERNVLDNYRNQVNYMLFGLLYKFFYNRGVRKRMQYLDHLATS